VRERRSWLLALAALAAFVGVMLVVGNLGEPRPELVRIPVDEVLAAGDAPADRYGDEEMRIVGWYAELAADCEGSDGGPDEEIAWLQRDCPLRVLLPEQPDEDVTQAQLEARGLRLAAPIGRPFPARARPEGVNLRIQQLVFVGHFDDPLAERCEPELRERCRNTFVVTTHRSLVR
jgi:hypothetical protein